jgi:hypothetical protein
MSIRTAKTRPPAGVHQLMKQLGLSDGMSTDEF